MRKAVIFIFTFAGKVTHNFSSLVGCSIFHTAKFEQTITYQHMLLRAESLIDGTDVAIILSLHGFITHPIFINS